jgi:hypothetical protein
MTDNLKLWLTVEKTPAEHTKKITGKSYQGTSPKPHFLVHRATETFGPCGIGWGFQIVEERIEEGAGGEKMHLARVRVWYEWNGKRGEVEHIGGTHFSGTRSSGKHFTDEDAPKKSVTDALVKALSMVGFAGDIFMGRYDDSKYVAELKSEEANGGSDSKPLFMESTIKTIATFKDVQQMTDWWTSDDQKNQRRDFGLSQADVEALKGHLTTQKAKIEGKQAA